MTQEPRLVEVRKSILKQTSDQYIAATACRRYLDPCACF